MPKFVRWFLFAVSFLLCAGMAGAQGKGKGGGKGKEAKEQPAPKGKGGPINLDDEGEGEQQQAGPVDEGPVTAGQMTEEAAQAKKLFDQERWSEAALMLKRVVDGETGDDAGNKQIAEYHLAISLYRLQFYQASYDIFRKIAERPNHLKFKETLLWLAKLATQLPEPADIIGSVGKYSREMIKRFDNQQQRELYWQLNHLLGRFMYSQRKFEEAIQLFESVGKDSPYYVKSLFFMGISYVQLRKSVPAVRAFQKIIDAIDEGVEGVEDESRMRDLANLSMARTFYSASIRLDQNNVPSIDEKKLSAAVKYWNLVDVASEYWLDALFEQSWAYFMAGDYPHALGNIHTIQSPYFPNSFYPEADIVRMVIYFTVCQYDDATALVAKFQKKYEPIAKELDQVLKRFEGEGSEEKFYEFLLQVRDGKANLSPALAPIVENALSDRELLKHIEYVRVLDTELKRYDKAPPSFKNSPVGADVEDNIKVARTAAVRKAGTLARRRYQRNLDELKEHLRSGQKIIVDVTNAQRKTLDEEIQTGQWSEQDAYEFGRIDPDSEHVIWPFDGEYWRDELGFYRQVVHSNCGTGKLQ
jgi:tetratricopeptide (TPR) repeat protein